MNKLKGCPRNSPLFGKFEFFEVQTLNALSCLLMFTRFVDLWFEFFWMTKRIYKFEIQTFDRLRVNSPVINRNSFSWSYCSLEYFLPILAVGLAVGVSSSTQIDSSTGKFPNFYLGFNFGFNFRIQSQHLSTRRCLGISFGDNMDHRVSFTW